MNWWWVNHGQTRDQEVLGSYLWSPKKNKDLSKNLTYDYMSEASPGDIIFSYAKGQIGAVGVVQESAVNAVKPKEFGSTGSNWAPSGWLLKAEFIDVPIPIRPKKEIQRIRDLLPVKYSPIRKTGDGNQRFYLTKISEDLGSRLLSMSGINGANVLIDLSRTEAIESAAESEEQRIEESGDIRKTVKKQLVESRRGQGLFKTRVWALEKWCRVTNVSDIRHLRASHIKPWCKSTNRERLDGCNGLLLAPHIDHLFDEGYISFSDAGELMVSSQLSSAVCAAWRIHEIPRPRALNQRQSQYMSYHRRNIFRRK